MAFLNRLFLCAPNHGYDFCFLGCAEPSPGQRKMRLADTWQLCFETRSFLLKNSRCDCYHPPSELTLRALCSHFTEGSEGHERLLKPLGGTSGRACKPLWAPQSGLAWVTL